MRILCFFLLSFLSSVHADTIENYMRIAENIPKMEMKADSDSQAWARSARNILILTSETICETVNFLNDKAKESGQKPLFCLPPGSTLDGKSLNEMIQKAYNNMGTINSNKNKMSVSEVALLALTKNYPCKDNQAEMQMQNINSMLHVGNSERRVM